MNNGQIVVNAKDIKIYQSDIRNREYMVKGKCWCGEVKCGE